MWSIGRREGLASRAASYKQAVLAALAGGSSALGFAPHGLWPFTMVAIAWMLASTVTSDTWIVAWRRGWLFGLTHFAVGLSWLPTAFSHQDAIPHIWGWPALLLLASYLAIYPASAFAAARLVGGRDPMRVVFLSASCWVLAEWLRGTLLSGFPWNPIGLIWLDLPYVSRTPAYVGSLGLSGLTVLVAGAVTLVFAGRAGAGAAVISLSSFLVASANGAAPSPLPQAPVRATIVQPNIAQHEKWELRLAQRHLTAHMALSGRRGTASQPRLLFWPEAAVPFPIEEDAALRQQLARLLGPRDLLLTGGTAMAEDADGNRFATNSMFVLGNGGRILFRYDKSHLVPFGEYLPFEGLLSSIGLARLVEGSFPFKPGTGPATLDLPGLLKVGPAICYEIIFPSDVIDDRDRPSFLFNPSNDAWFGRWGPPQHLAHARMRSIEEGLPTVRATTSGISALIDANGSILAEIPPGRSGNVDALLPQPHPPTLFARAGNSLPLAIAAIVAFAFWRRTKAALAITSLP